jgi:alkylation response protein AidB-like acyl-CoA dehydrogenase
VYIDEKYGGLGGSTPIMNMVLVTEELSKACGGISLAFAATGLGTIPIIVGASEEQKEKYLPQIASGQKLAAFGLTEASAGSNVAGMTTRAVKDGDYYILNGTKGTEGFTFGKKEDKLGIRASVTRELVFQDCRVHKSQLLGREGTGFITAMKTFDLSRPGVGAQALGIAAGALDLAVEFSNNRKQFGVPVSSFQGLRFMLADMAMKVESSRALIYATARHIDSHPGERYTLYSAMAKCWASDMAMQVTTDALQVFGGHGYMREYPIEKYMRDAKITQIYEGTNQIQRDEIGRALVQELHNK